MTAEKDPAIDFKAFLETTLLPDLQRAEAARAVVASELRAYEELRDLVTTLQKARTGRLLGTARRPIPCKHRRMHGWIL